jgi:hypothetical protein
VKPVNVYKGKLLNIAKLTLLLGTVCFIIYKLFFAYNLDEIVNGFSFEWNSQHFVLLGFTLLLMILNWWAETVKWMVIMGKHEPVTPFQSYKSVLSGITLSIITPNQLGDIVGKAVYLNTFNKVKGAVVSMLGGLAQTIASVTFGSYGLWYLAFNQQKIGQPLFIGGLIFITVGLIGLYYVYFHIHWLDKLGRWKFIAQYVAIFTQYTSAELWKIMLFSLLRFSVYSFQYFLLLHFFNVDISFLNAALCISSIFFVQGFLPSFILIEMGVRGATALFFFGLFTTATAGVLLAAYSLWIINLMIPAIAGMYYLLKLKWSNPS